MWRGLRVLPLGRSKPLKRSAHSFMVNLTFMPCGCGISVMSVSSSLLAIVFAISLSRISGIGRERITDTNVKSFS